MLFDAACARGSCLERERESHSRRRTCQPFVTPAARECGRRARRSWRQSTGRRRQQLWQRQRRGARPPCDGRRRRVSPPGADVTADGKPAAWRRAAAAAAAARTPPTNQHCNNCCGDPHARQRARACDSSRRGPCGGGRWVAQCTGRWRNRALWQSRRERLCASRTPRRDAVADARRSERHDGAALSCIQLRDRHGARSRS